MRAENMREGPIFRLLMGATLAVAFLLAPPAEAGGREFDDGFEDQLGQLVAAEVFFLGRWMLAGAYHHAVHSHEPSAHETSHHDPEFDGPCEVETHERIHRDRDGEVVEYERREVCRYSDGAESGSEDWYDY